MMDDKSKPRMSSAAGNCEIALANRLRNRDMKAFEELYEKYRNRLSFFISNVISKPQIVEEVFNDTMMVVWQKIGDFSGDSKLSTWIFAIAYRKAIKARTKIDEPVAEELASYEDMPENEAEKQIKQGQLKKILTQSLSKLSHEHRMVINLTYFEEMHYREIAEIMECPVDTVKTRMFHARRKLKKSLGGNVIDWL